VNGTLHVQRDLTVKLTPDPLHSKKMQGFETCLVYKGKFTKKKTNVSFVPCILNYAKVLAGSINLP